MELKKKHCVPCSEGSEPFDKKQIDKYLKEVKDWNLVDLGFYKLEKTFIFKDFLEAIDFVLKVSRVCEVEGHHANIHVYYNKVVLDVYTHKINGLSENDFILASKIDGISL